MPNTPGSKDDGNGSVITFAEVVDLDQERTADVRSDGDFARLMISAHVVKALKQNGFRFPSPVQQKAIPTGLSGFDMLVQAKSGTGKTLVFSVMAVENLQQLRQLQRLIVAPTREIAIQISQTIKKIAPPWVRTGVFTGGTPLSLDISTLKNGIHIAIGSTGRVCQLVNEGKLNVNSVDLFVLDEADQLMADSFATDINFLFSSLPSGKQVAVFSATYPRGLEMTLSKYMKSPSLIRLNSDDVQLIGIKQYAVLDYNDPTDVVVYLLKRIQFRQALLFCNLAESCGPLCEALMARDIDAAVISSQMDQSHRNAVIDRLKKNNLKVLVSTDVTARGIDSSYVDIVINLEPAVNCETYFHRIGRAARYGAHGAALTILSCPRMCARFCHLVRDGQVRAKTVRSIDSIPSDLPTNQEFFEEMELFKAFSGSDNAKERSKQKDWNASDKKAEVKLHDGPLYVPPKNSDGERWNYERDHMLDIREYSGPVSSDLSDHLNDLELLMGSFFGRDLENVAKDLKSLRVSRQDKENLGPYEFCKKNDAELNPKPKFVPSRLKNKKKFYLRGELISIRNLFSADQWRQFAETKFNLSEEPFVDDVPSEAVNMKLFNERCSESDLSLPSTSTGDKQKRILCGVSSEKEYSPPHDLPKHEKKVLSENVQRYSRKQMIGITKLHTSQWWREYVTSRFDTNEDPFVMDPAMRCSVSEQIRRQRIREKNARQKVILERKKAVEHQDKVLSSARTPSRREVTDVSWESYCTRVNSAWKDRLEKEASSKPPKYRAGPVVEKRLASEEFLSDVKKWNSVLSNFHENFAYACRLKQELNVETGCSANASHLEAQQDMQIGGSEATEKFDPSEVLNKLQMRDNKKASMGGSRTSSFVATSSMERLVDDMVRSDMETEVRKDWKEDRDYVEPSPGPLSKGSVANKLVLQPDVSEVEDEHDEEESDGLEGVMFDDATSEISSEGDVEECTEDLDTQMFQRSYEYNTHFATVMQAFLKSCAGGVPPF